MSQETKTFDISQLTKDIDFIMNPLIDWIENNLKEGNYENAETYHDPDLVFCFEIEGEVFHVWMGNDPEHTRFYDMSLLNHIPEDRRAKFRENIRKYCY